MPLFSRRRVEPTEAERREAAGDLERLRHGGIPAMAEKRLKRVAAASEPFFTSDLSAKQYAIAQLGGLQPVAQVMGSAVVQSGWGSFAVNGPWIRPGEVRVLAGTWNLARQRAFDRLRQEAEFAGADGVIGLKMSWREFTEDGNVELILFGTAVRDTAFPRRGRAKRAPAVSTLSAQEVDQLRRVGAEPVGVVHTTTAWKTDLTRRAPKGIVGRQGGFGWNNVDVPEVAQCVARARRRAMAEIEKQAAAVEGNQIVISELRHEIHHTEKELEYRQSVQFTHSFYVTLHLVGTAVKLGVHRPHPTELSGTAVVMDLGRR